MLRPYHMGGLKRQGAREKSRALVVFGPESRWRRTQRVPRASGRAPGNGVGREGWGWGRGCRGGARARGGGGGGGVGGGGCRGGARPSIFQGYLATFS